MDQGGGPSRAAQFSRALRRSRWATIALLVVCAIALAVPGITESTGTAGRTVLGLGLLGAGLVLGIGERPAAGRR